ncbi:probable serine/threonine-protein kinase pats1 [Argopecten irradians]|uniref:probable serine/threonine-protein kinase pats1 n=1 Tax=Argopecten irradians TaxID=31199 RepID=UPI0037106DF7
MAAMMTKPPASEVNQSDVFSSNITHEMFMELIEVQNATHTARSDMAFVSLWDMGGHLQFQTSHNVFLSSHGIYLLVFKLQEFLKDKQETDRLKKWIRMIGTFSAVEYNTGRTKEHYPPLILVGTFLDELKAQFSGDYKSRIDDIKSSIIKFPELSSHKHVRFCTIDNTLDPKQGYENLEKLRGQITDLAEHQDQWGRELPYKWLHLELEIMMQRENGTKILTLNDVLQINEKSAAPFDHEEEIKMALEYLHCTRSVIYFREIDCIVNDPQFLVDFFSVLITEDDFFLKQDDMILARDLEQYKTKGELTPELINGILNQRQNNDFLSHADNLLALMEKFGLIVKMQITDNTTGDVRFSKTYTVPSKLGELQDLKDITFSLKQLAVSKTMCLIFDDLVPEELFNRVFAVILRTFKISALPGTAAQDTIFLFRGFGCFEINNLCSMILSMHWERSTIAVTVFSPSQPKLPPGSGRLAREALERILQETLAMSCQQHYEYSYKMHCDFYLNPYDTPIDMYSVMYAQGGMPCKGDDCRGKHRLTVSDLLVWGITETGTVPKRHGYNNMDIFLDRRPTPKELGRLSFDVVASSLERFFIQLGLSSAEISNIREEAKTQGVETKTTKMFLRWTCHYPNLTFRYIQDAMKEADMAWDELGSSIERSQGITLDGMESTDELNRPLGVGETKGVLRNIGKNYFILFLELGLSASAIERCEVNHPDIEKRLEALLMLWINTFKEQATIIKILKAMKMCGMDWTSTARLCCNTTATSVLDTFKWLCNIL